MSISSRRARRARPRCEKETNQPSSARWMKCIDLRSAPPLVRACWPARVQSGRSAFPPAGLPLSAARTARGYQTVCPLVVEVRACLRCGTLPTQRSRAGGYQPSCYAQRQNRPLWHTRQESAIYCLTAVRHQLTLHVQATSGATQVNLHLFDLLGTVELPPLLELGNSLLLVA